MAGAGSLRHRIAFDKREDVNPDAPKDYGNTRSEFVEQFVVAGAVQPKFGGESVTAARLAGRQPVVITIRQSDAARQVKVDWRARDARTGKLYNIRSLTDQNDRRAWIEILAEDTGEFGEAAADVTAPTITSASTRNNAEGSTLSHALTANESVTWSIVGGADQARFEISGSTLRWAGNGTKDFEAPDDADTNNTYVVTVRATDTSSNTTDQTITVTVTDVSEDVTAPTITSANTANCAEGATLAHSLTANETVTWSIVGGTDQLKFEISGSTLRWAGDGTKDFEVPDDADVNNTYVVQVRATDTSSNTTDQTITVTVTDVTESGADSDPYPVLF